MRAIDAVLCVPLMQLLNVQSINDAPNIADMYSTVECYISV